MLMVNCTAQLEMDMMGAGCVKMQPLRPTVWLT